MERKALYNSLRINARKNPSLKVQDWQIRDYHKMSTEALFASLEQFGLHVDRSLFLSLADEVESPEELSDHLISDEIPEDVADQIYLNVFELWRKLLPERQTLSIFCDQLDYEIEAHDQGDAATLERVEDALASLREILDQNLDEGGSPKELFAAIQESCAHDVEGFLYDFIEMEIENGNDKYAGELIEAFSPYVTAPKWFLFLKAQLVAKEDEISFKQLFHGLVQQAAKEKDPEFIFSLLFYAAQQGDKGSFLHLFQTIIPLLEVEEDLIDLITACEDFAHFRDDESLESTFRELILGRKGIEATRPFNPQDPVISVIRQALKV